MANTFTDAEKATLCDILEMDIVKLNAHIDYFDSDITDAIDIKIKTDVATWDGLATDPEISIHPNNRNFGAQKNGSAVSNKIQRRVARWLFVENTNFGSSTLTLGRG